MLTRINDTWFTRILTLLFLAGAIVAATGILILAPTAHADTGVNDRYDAYFDDLRAHSPVRDPDLSLGNRVCIEESQGIDAYSIQRGLFMISDEISTMDEAKTFLDIADKDLCQGAGQTSDFGPFKS